jgi:prepilin-type processing-associated H-X9-DG protein
MYPGYYSVVGNTPVPSTSFMWGPSVYPEYMTDYSIIFCPSDPTGQDKKNTIAQLQAKQFIELAQQFRDYSYMYLGWATRTDNDWLTWKMAAKAVQNANGILTGDFVINDISSNGVTEYRLREGIERFFTTDINNHPAGSAMAQSQLPVMWDIICANPGGETGGSNRFNHVPGGMNVLYMDGHVSFLRWIPDPQNLGLGTYPCDSFLANKLGKGGPTDPTNPNSI